MEFFMVNQAALWLVKPLLIWGPHHFCFDVERYCLEYKALVNKFCFWILIRIYKSFVNKVICQPGIHINIDVFNHPSIPSIPQSNFIIQFNCKLIIPMNLFTDPAADNSLYSVEAFQIFAMEKFHWFVNLEMVLWGLNFIV